MWWPYVLIAVVLLIAAYFIFAYMTFNVFFRRPLPVPKVYIRPLFDKDFKKHVPEIKRTQHFYGEVVGEKVSIISSGVKLSGTFYENKESKKIIVFVHGYYSDGLYDIGYLGKLHQDLGVSLLIIDQRSCGDSEGKFTSFGIFERFDVREWLFYIEKRFNGEKDVYLHGVSMGAATSLLVTTLNGLPQSFKGVIADCGYSGTKGVMLYVGKRILKIRPSFLFWGVNIFARKLAGFNLKEMKVSQELKKNDTIPTLLIHGIDDKFVPFNMSVKNFKALAVKDKKLVAVPEAEHCGSYLEDRELYFKEVEKFINEH